MKILNLLFIAFMLTSCASTSDFSISINYDVENGYYESLEVATWESDRSFCIGLAVNKPYFGEKWMPITGFQFTNESKTELVAIKLSPRESIKDIYLVSDRWKKDTGRGQERIIRDGIKAKEILHLEAVVEDNVLYVTENSELLFRTKLNFEPKSLLLLTSSANSFIGFKDGTCL